LSVLDQSPIPAGATAADALANTLDLARTADRLGYTRYWLAEHHNTLGLAGSAPEVLAARVAAETSAIRVGSGGVMLPHYAPLHVAEQFRVLATLYPGRIDLGIGRAPGGNSLSAGALRAGVETPFPHAVQDLIGWVEDRLDPRHPFATVRATPEPPEPPDIWMLGSSDYGAAVAAVLGLPYSFAHFINPSIAGDVVAMYRERYKPSPRHPEPRVSLGVGAVVAETTEEALRLSASVRLWRRRLLRGDPGPVPTVEEALAEVGDEPPRDPEGRLAVGAPDEVRDRLAELASLYGADELVALTICHDHAARVRSYELLASAFSLTPRDEAVAVR
jgi:luciferase family oxidoreductase group 1